MEIPISVFFSNPCLLTFNQCCIKDLKSLYSPGFVGKKEHFVFPSCFITSQHFCAPETRLLVTAGQISKIITGCVQVAVLHQILPPTSAPSHCFHKWHLSGSRPGLGSSVHPVFLQETFSVSLHPGLNTQIYWFYDQRTINKPDRAVPPCPSLPAGLGKLCFTQATRRAKWKWHSRTAEEDSFLTCESTWAADLARLNLWACTDISQAGQSIWLRVAVIANFLRFPKEYFPTAFVFPFSPRPACSDECLPIGGKTPTDVWKLGIIITIMCLSQK